MADVVVTRFAGNATEWDDFVRSQSGWTHFHLYGWRDVSGRVLGHECVYLVARESTTQTVVGVLPMLRVKSLVFGHYLVSMPFVNYGGPLGSGDAIRALVAEAATIAQNDRVKLLELRSRTEMPVDLPASHRKLTVLLDLPADRDALLKSFSAKVRSQIKRPTKDGVVIRFGVHELPAFYTVFARHMRDLGTPVLSRRFFTALGETFPNDLHVAVAYHNGQPIAGGVGFLWNGEFEITWASALRSHNAMSPNMLVYSELMALMIQRGATVFNFGRCSRDSGTYRFKMQWGSREEQLWWYQFAPGAVVGQESATPSPNSGAFAMAARVWSRLPLAVTNRLGPAIVRFIP